jgi:hypothetical protein
MPIVRRYPHPFGGTLARIAAASSSTESAAIIQGELNVAPSSGLSARWSGSHRTPAIARLAIAGKAELAIMQVLRSFARRRSATSRRDLIVISRKISHH